MEIQEYVEATLNQKCAEERLINMLSDRIGIEKDRVKSINLVTDNNGTKVFQTISIDLIGPNRFRSEDLKDFKGLVLVTPNTIEINVGEIDL